MDEQLKHLKESMDRTVLKNGSFRPEEKLNILRAIRMEKQKRQRRRFRLGAALSVAVGFCLLVGLSWIVYSQLQDHPNDMASQSTNMSKHVAAGDIKGQQEYSAKDQAVHPVAKADISLYKSTSKDKKVITKPFYTYVVLNNYYYKETGDMVSEDKLGQEIGRVKRAADSSVQSGDSNNIPPGAIYAIHGEDPAVYIAAKGSIIRNGKKEEGYLIFKKFMPVTH